MIWINVVVSHPAIRVRFPVRSTFRLNFFRSFSSTIRQLQGNLGYIHPRVSFNHHYHPKPYWTVYQGRIYREGGERDRTPPRSQKRNKIIKKLYVNSSSLPIKHHSLLRRVANLKKISGIIKKCISTLKKFYKYLKKLQIFFLNIAVSAEIVFSLQQNRDAHGSAVANMFEKSQW